MRIISIITATLLFVGCNYSNYNNKEIQSINPLSAVDITLDQLDDLIVSTNQIKLDTSSFIRTIKKALIAPNGNIILMDKDKVHQYCRLTGEYICSYGRVGRARNEYISLTDICIDADNNQILILDGMSRVICYDIDSGEHQKSIDIKYDQSALRVDGIVSGGKDEIYVISCNMNNRSMQKVTPTLYKFNSEGDCIDSYLEVDDAMITMSLSTQGYDNRYILRPFDYQNIIYEVAADGVIPLYFVDLEGKEAKRGAIYGGSDIMDLGAYFGNNSYKYPSMVVCSKSYISMMLAEPNFSAATYLFNRENKQGYRFSTKDGRTQPINPIIADENYIYYVYGLYDSSDIEQRADPLTQYFYNKYGVLEKSDNPSIIYVKYK